MKWSYKFAFDEMREMMENRPWLLVDDSISSADHDEFIKMQTRLLAKRGWEWFKQTLRGRVFPRLNLTTVTTWDGARGQVDLDSQSIAKIQREFPGASIVSLIGEPHVISGPSVSTNILVEIKRHASEQRWTKKFASDNNGLLRLMSDAWKMPVFRASGVLTWLLALGIPATQIEQGIREGASPQDIITQVSPETPAETHEFGQDRRTPIRVTTLNNADFPQNPANFEDFPAETLDNYSEIDNMPRGIRNNNPGNLERNKTVWQGMSEEQSDERFITFSSPEYGIRAMARVLKNYGRRHGLRTVEQIISRWAPASENQTSSYVQYVSQELGVSPSSSLDLNNPDLLGRLIQVIIQYENGTNPYGNEVISRGVALESKPKPG